MFGGADIEARSSHLDQHLNRTTSRQNQNKCTCVCVQKGMWVCMWPCVQKKMCVRVCVFRRTAMTNQKNTAKIKTHVVETFLRINNLFRKQINV